MATTINPVIHYRDLEAGARFLVESFGFVEHQTHTTDDGSVQYVELSLNGAPLGLGPHTEGSMFDTGPAVVYISLDEVDSMHERARSAGAEILMAPTPIRTTARGTSWPPTAKATFGASAPTSPVVEGPHCRRIRENVAMNRYVLFYESADDVLSKAPQVYPAHLARLQEFKARGELLMVGTFADPQADGSMAIFDSREGAETFATGDPFVLQGVVRSWTVKEWFESSQDI